LNEVVNLHLRNKRIATVTAVRPTSRFAELVITDEQVLRFSEKPPITEGWVSGGFFIFNRKLLDYIDKDEPLEVAPLNRLALDGQLSAYQHTGYWQCVDTFRELMMVEKLWQEDRAPWKLW
jgi:glucose-1-phosphate cytidylyltransferase